MNHLEVLHAASGNRSHIGRKKALIKRFEDFAPRELAPHRFISMAAQVAHESSGFRYIKEIWGPTRAQKRYEGREDLGNVMRGDGKRFAGHDLIQVTGRANHRALSDWVEKTFGIDVDFEVSPELLLTNEWLGIGALWYWTQRVPQKYVETGNQDMVTYRVNGGYNGFGDRLDRYDRAAKVALGVKSVAAYQSVKGLEADGAIGPITRAAMHSDLVAIGGRTSPVRPKSPPKPPSAPRKRSWLDRLLGRK